MRLFLWVSFHCYAALRIHCVLKCISITIFSFKLLSIVFLFFRLYLINSPVVRAENLRFKEEGVRDILKDVFLPWYNAYRFLVQNVQILEHKVQIS